ncbi:helicase HerA-like domain-containing protein [Schaalia vaccimaxillae]|uniref:helicase HerA-like domain-containing protein n=1 Tax=Schaalia vaccimaxillae TaxID=183916 RepID=UPI0003B3D1F8|nr:helicase HerA-like domain-containing protein [Schaalia vaccimaxillae]
MSDEIEELRAQLAAAEATAKAAEAEAARAKAEALKAQLAAAQSAANTEASDGTAQDTAITSTEQVRESAAPTTGLSDFATEIHSAYSFDVPSLTLGALIDEGSRVPTVKTSLPLGMLNRHLLVAGATGTGKTRTLQLLAEGLSAAGTSVLLCDVKGDLTGLAEAGASSDKLLARTAANGQNWAPASFPVELLNLGGLAQQFTGTPIRARICDFGPILLARALDLNTIQEQALQLMFSWADQNQLELIDLADLRSVIAFLTSDEGAAELTSIGGVSKATAGVILRTLTALESQGADQFFGDPGFDTDDLIRANSDGKGVISLLGVGDITSRPGLVSAVIMWLLADLFTGLPEVGDTDKPKLVFFFDEAHLLFADATKEFLRQVVQTVRLIRSKGVGIVFVTQTPKDIPSDVLAQLGSRIQHGLRAVTPDDQKKLKATVQTFPQTDLALDEVLTNLGTGEAVVTVLNPKGNPTPVAPTAIWAPASVMGPASAEAINQINVSSPINAKYATAINPESAEEKLAQRRAQAEAEKARAIAEAEAKKRQEKEAAELEKQLAKEQAAAQKEAERQLREAEKAHQKEEAAKQRAAERRAKQIESALGSVLRTAGREITRSIFGTRRR